MEKLGAGVGMLLENTGRLLPSGLWVPSVNIPGVASYQ